MRRIVSFGWLYLARICPAFGWIHHGTGTAASSGHRHPPCFVGTARCTPSSLFAVKELKEQYAEARNVRTLQGHDAAMPLYQAILNANPDDVTAGTRLAASPETPTRHDLACGGNRWEDMEEEQPQQEKIQSLRQMLVKHNYHHFSVSDFFGVPVTQPQGSSLSCMGPLFVSPVAPGTISTSNYPLSDDNNNVSGLACLISMFLLGLAVPQAYLEQTVGHKHLQAMQDMGWCFPCSMDPSWMVPYVHVFPLGFTASHNTLFLVTDLHPKVLSTTSLGTRGDGPGNVVMYIGPDSLALAQHFDPYSYLQTTFTEATNNSLTGLDLGTGSGIQALAALMHWNETIKHPISPSKQQIRMIAIDVNPRALRFAKFNAMLNGFRRNLDLIHADLVTGRCLDGLEPHLLRDRLRKKSENIHLILANPPFLPDPTAQQKNITSSTIESIGQRYGLFSSGGATGEDILQRIIEMAGTFLQTGGVLGVVSEFFVQTQDPDFQRFSQWWERGTSNMFMGSAGAKIEATNNSAVGETSRGVLFVNESPISADTYAARRADNPLEQETWLRHLHSFHITTCSPGLLYIQKGNKHFGLNLEIAQVPKTKQGSIWTPSNVDAIYFTQQVTCQFFGWRQQ